MTSSADTQRPSQALVVLDQPDRRDIQFLEERIDEHNIGHTGITDARLLAILLRDDYDEIIGGLYGWTWGGCCEVQTLWVHERWRSKGLGTQLMTAAEAEARARGATQMVLSTHSFQGPEFYRRLGFVEVGRVENYPEGHSSIYLRKTLLANAE
jgi:ribosomal protein S18 acetylase RimI-like enzyme